MIITHKVVNTEYQITDGTYTIFCNAENGKISVSTNEGKQFCFIDSEPKRVKAIAELIVYAAEFIQCPSPEQE